MKDFHFSKKFLNKDGYLGIAAILTSINFSPADKMWHTVELNISDCRNEIKLDLTLEEEGSNNYENSMHKLNTLIEQLGWLKVKMQEAKEEYDRRKALFDAKKEEMAKEREGRKITRSEVLEALKDESDNGTGSTNS